MVHCARRLWEAGLLAGADGNISVRLGPDRLLVTPTAVLKRELGPRDLVLVDLRGSHLGGFRKATTELDLHLRLHRQQRDLGAVIHAHPPTATGFAVAGLGLDENLLPEVTVLFGRVPLLPYATPGTPAVGEAVAGVMTGHSGVLLANHGAVTWGPSLEAARIRMESLEHAARILLAAHQLGRVNSLTPEQVHELKRTMRDSRT